jgi:hypothetical protein
MTTTLRSPMPAASGERALRIPPIAASLLPVEISQSRRLRKVRRIVLTALIAVVIVLAAWFVLASYQTSMARGSLHGVESDAQQLLRQQRAYAEVVGVQAQSQAIRAQLAALLADDLSWSRLLSSLRKAAPADVRISGVFAALASGGNRGASGSGSVASQLPGTPGEKSIGTVTVTGTASGKEAAAAYVDALAGLPHFGSPLLSDATEQSGVLRFTVRLDITDSALGGRYTQKRGNGPGTQ